MSSSEVRRSRRIKDYAQFRGVSTRTVYNWAERHGLKISHIGSIPVVFDDDDVAFIAKFREPAGAE